MRLDGDMSEWSTNLVESAKRLAFRQPRREGACEPLSSRFARVRVCPAHRDDNLTEPRPEEWLLIEWPEGEAEPANIGSQLSVQTSILVACGHNQAARAAASRNDLDDQMRVAIRNSRFVVADLTHACRGSYWEGGFAEGLGRPVIYTCEKRAWEAEKSHFDTNHLTTVIWDKNDLATAEQQLTAIIRNTLPDEAKMDD